MATREQQERKIDQLRSNGWKWDKDLSAKASACILRKGQNIWFFGINGEIEYNPKGIIIDVK